MPCRVCPLCGKQERWHVYAARTYGGTVIMHGFKLFGTFAVVVGLLGCAGRIRQGETTMPNPEGCFVQVWDGPQLTGITDYINGPKAYLTLRDLPGARVWRNRIRSVKTGVAARATVYGEENFQGPTLRLLPDREYRTFAEGLSGRIASMNVECDQSQPAKAQRTSPPVGSESESPDLSPDVPALE